MNSVEQWGMDKRPFLIICNHCLRKSKAVPWESVDGRETLAVVKELGFRIKDNGEDGGWVVCSSWCHWRHGMNSGIHKWLNILFHKGTAFKQ
jgi:hypothetical protein